VKNTCAKPVNPEEPFRNFVEPVETSLLSPDVVPNEKALVMRKAAVFPVVHTPYNYD
jgi:hypothetical protein